MPLQNYQYDKIMREYSKTQSRNRSIFWKNTNRKSMPKSPESERSMKKWLPSVHKRSRALLSGQASGTEDLKAAICSPGSGADCSYLVCNSSS